MRSYTANIKLMVIVVVALVLIAMILMALMADQRQQIEEQQTQDSREVTPEEVSIPDNFQRAVITPEDTIALLSESSEIFINLQQRNWQNLQWSPDGQFISVLGTEADNSLEEPIYDLYIFDTNTREWRQATFYEALDNGITGYDWYAEDEIRFTQGGEENNWLHSYSYADTEILKLEKLTGQLLLNDENLEYLFFWNPNTKQIIAWSEEFTSSQNLDVLAGLDVVDVLKPINFSVDKVETEYLITFTSESERYDFIWNTETNQLTLQNQTEVGISEFREEVSL